MILTVTLNTAVDKLYLLESMQPYEVMRVQTVNNTASGKGMNVSRIAALSGEEVTAMGFVGGYNGMLFESLIAECGIKKAFTHVAANTRCCINVRDAAAGKSTEFLEPGSPVTEEDAAKFVRDFENQLSNADVVAISGSVPKGVPENIYAVLIELAKKQGKPVILDTSGACLKNALKARPTMIKPNTDEIQQLLNVNINSRTELIDAAKKLHETGIEIVAVSMGKEGVLVVCDEGVYQGITPNLPVVNTVGCGDSMVAGFAVSLARKACIETAIHYAVSVSTANALNQTTGFYVQEDLEKILPLVTVKKLS